MRIAHVIVGLNRGGAESVLVRICNDKLYDNKYLIISMTGLGTYGETLKNSKIKVVTLNMNTFVGALTGISVFYREVKCFDPQVVQTWMYHANLFGGLLVKPFFNVPVIWNIRCSVIFGGYFTDKIY